MKKYPFINCLHPRNVVNSNGDSITVGCGRCEACLKSRADKMSFLCSVEESDNKFCHFVTLTYSNEYVPLCKPVRDNVAGGFHLVNLCDRFSSLGETVGFCDDRDYISSNHDWLYLLLNKINLNGCIPYCNSIDTQRFMKRLRKCLTKKYKCYEPIRYYVVSEYGPIHFRPHYHLLLFYNEQRTFTYLPKAIRESWKYGRVDASLSRGNATSYCARYVNSFSHLPRLFENRALKPFAHHSQFFAQRLFEGKKKAIYENEPERFIRMCRCVNNKVVEYSPWRSLVSRFFPRCKGFANKSYYELYYSYTAYRDASKFYGSDIVSELAKKICKDAQNDAETNSLTRLFFDDTPEIIAYQLYLSKHFLNFCCDDSESYRDVIRHLNYIVVFYSRLDYSRLVNQLENEQEFVDDGFDDFDLFFDNKCNLDALVKHPLYLSYRAKTLNDFEKSIKHKRLNDLNKIFC